MHNTHNFDLKMRVRKGCMLYKSNKFFENLPEFNLSMYSGTGGKQTLPVINKNTKEIT